MPKTPTPPQQCVRFLGLASKCSQPAGNKNMIVFSLELFSFLDDVEDETEGNWTWRSCVCGRVLRPQIPSPQSRDPSPWSSILTQCMVKSGECQRSSIELLDVVFPSPPFVLFFPSVFPSVFLWMFPSEYPIFEIRTATLAYSLHYISRCH